MAFLVPYSFIFQRKLAYWAIWAIHTCSLFIPLNFNPWDDFNPDFKPTYISFICLYPCIFVYQTYIYHQSCLYFSIHAFLCIKPIFIIPFFIKLIFIKPIYIYQIIFIKPFIYLSSIIM